MPITFDFSSNVASAPDPDNTLSNIVYQIVDRNTLQLTGDQGGWGVADEHTYIGMDVGVLHGAALFKGASNFALSLTLSLAAGRIFDLTSLNLWDQWGQAGVQFRLTTSKGSVDIAPVDGQGGVAFHSYSPVLQGVSSVEISLVDRNLTFAPAVDDIVLSNITFVPRFSGSGNTLAVEQNGDAADIGALLRVTDVDSGQTLTWTQAGGPSHGTLVMVDASAAAGEADIAPGGTLTYRPDAGYVGTDTFTVQVSDGLAVSQKTITVNVAPQAPGMPALDPGSDTATDGDNVTAADAVTFTGTSGAGDSSSRVRVFIDIDGDGAFDAGEANGTAIVADGSWRVENIDTSSLASGTYDVRAIVTSADGALASAASAALSLTVDRTAPMATIGAIRLSADTGANTADMVTNSAAQTIHATLSAPLDSGDIVLGSVDGGQSWADITAMVDGTALAWTGATLAAGGTIRLRVADEHGNQGVAAVAAYTLDTTAPMQTVTGLALAADNGSNVTDFVTNVRTQTISGTLSGATGTGEVVEVSLDGGTSWSAATNAIGSAAWSLAGQTLAASGTLQVRVSDLAGNHGPVRAQAYTIDSEAPVAARPVRPDLVNPNGSFTFAVTYGDNGGAGLDAATFGTGNVTVRGALGALNVSGYAVAGGTVTYTVDAPAGGWVAGALGDYTIGIVGGAVRDLAGNTVAASANALTFHAGVRPSATVAVADSTLTAGETTTVTIAFAQPVLGLDLADLRVAHGTLSALVKADDGRTWTATLTPSAGAWATSNTVTLDMGGVMSADGTAGSGQVQSNAYAVQTGTPPAPPAPATNATMDGVPVLSLTSIDAATGFEVRTITVPSVPAGRASGDLADIVLGAAAGTLKASLTVGLPAGTGLQVGGPSALLTHPQALLDLTHRTGTPALADAGKAFLAGLGVGVPLQTATVAPVGGNATVPLTIGAAGSGVASAIVIDARQLAASATIQLDHVHFAAVIGQATLRGGAGDNHVIGDDASQSIFLGAGNDVLLGGGGNDTVGSAAGNDTLDGGVGNDLVVGGIGNDRLAGGAGDDIVQGGRSERGAWSFALDGNGLLSARHETATFAPGQQETVKLAELNHGASGLAFLDASATALTDIALLYHAAFGRAPDLGGLNFYLEHGDTAFSIAHNFSTSVEWRETGLERLDNAAFVRQMYEQVLGRKPDAAGFAYWTAQLEGVHGTYAKRADVLVGFALSDEARALHKAGIVIGAGNVAHEGDWILGSGDDRLTGGAGNDVLVGGDGTDTAVYDVKRADARVTLGKDGAVHVVSAGGTDTIQGIELGQFTDGTVDLRFTQASAAKLTAVGMLYQAVLDRAADVGGFAFWAAQDVTTAQMAAGFAGSAEFQGRYGALGDAAFVQALYANSGLAKGAVGGSAGWVDYLQTHSRAELIGTWVEQQAVQDAQFATGGLWLV